MISMHGAPNDTSMKASGRPRERQLGDVITVEGVIDAPDVAELRAAVESALERAPEVEVDLRAVERISPEAVTALAECAQVGRRVVFRFGTANSAGSRRVR
jgi:hypothetical protein